MNELQLRIVKGRVSGKDCSICSGKYVQKGFNDLLQTHPLHLKRT